MYAKRAKNSLIAYSFLLPGLLFILVWLVYPTLSALNISLRDWNLMPGQPSPFVGLANYIQAFKDPIFWLALKNTSLYAVVTVIGQLLLGLTAALLLDACVHGRVFFRTVYYLPVITSWVVVSMLFGYIFNSSPAGLINYLLVDVLHVLAEPVSWLTEANTAMIAIYTLGIWKGVGFTMLILLAAIQSLPDECFAAAQIDGASGFQTLCYITLPLLAPTLALVTIMLTIGAFQAFIPVSLITGGGPLHRTEFLLTYIYSQAFRDLNYSLSTAMSFILAVLVFCISQAQIRLMKPVDNNLS